MAAVAVAADFAVVADLAAEFAVEAAVGKNFGRSEDHAEKTKDRCENG